MIKPDSCEGIRPVRELEYIPNVITFVNSPSDEGIVPKTRLLLMRKVRHEDSSPNELGIVEVNAFEYTSNL